ncbi:MAG: MgtC/SapB family protein [Verrucomicrobiae bacterium]|nr:MgtC/SapB family protein [Verrucomicrobiae bacterium]
MLSPSHFIARLVLAALLGSLIGLERERLQWVAGLRTHMLVCVGASLIMIVSSFGFADILGHPNVTLDPSRVAAQVVSGIGFLGAGTILLRREVIRGLTTAASLWTVAAIGLAVGGGLYTGAVAATVLILGILAGLKPLERRFAARRPQVRSVVVRFDARTTSPAAIEAIMAQGGVTIRHAETTAGGEPSQKELHLLTRATADEISEAMEYLETLPGVEHVEIENS